jgi:hypothetical protein
MFLGDHVMGKYYFTATKLGLGNIEIRIPEFHVYSGTNPNRLENPRNT